MSVKLFDWTLLLHIRQQWNLSEIKPLCGNLSMGIVIHILLFCILKSINALSSTSSHPNLMILVWTPRDYLSFYCLNVGILFKIVGSNPAYRWDLMKTAPWGIIPDYMCLSKFVKILIFQSLFTLILKNISLDIIFF